MPKRGYRPVQGRALFYTRDSGGKHEMTPSQYVTWACRESQKLGLSFRGTPDMIEAMIRNGEFAHGDIFLDFDVQGHEFERDGLDALFAEAERDLTVSHVLIPRRDRFARPKNPTDAIQLEIKLRSAGVTMMFMDRIAGPLQRGQSPNIGDMIISVVDYYKAGQDRRELAEKMILTQIALAQHGFAVGGRAPYAFDRWLVKADGTPVRPLAEKERVRQSGHHTAWLPATDERISIALRIREMLKSLPASRVAAQLTWEGIPSPDAGRTRTDRGVRHKVSGVWHQTTIINIGRNPLFAAITVVGRRSMGDQLRFTPQGPRELGDADFRIDNKPKVVSNPVDAQITGTARFAPVVAPAEHQELKEILDSRAGSQRGKSRSRDPDKNPLGARVFDLNCTWPMYRVPCNGSFQYKCGLYHQSHGEKCEHNHVDGKTATRVALQFLKDKISSPERLDKLTARLHELAATRRSITPDQGRKAERQSALSALQADLAAATRNLALAKDEQQYRAVATVFDDLKRRETILLNEVRQAGDEHQADRRPDELVAVALSLLNRLPDLVDDEDNLAAIGQAFRLVNLRLFLRFGKVQVKRRLLNKVAGGVVTFGNAPPPTELYCGPTGRRAIHLEGAAVVAAGPGARNERAAPDPIDTGSEGNSLRNVNRGDRI